MGYRSQVRALIYGDKEQLEGFIVLHSLVLNSPVFRQFQESIKRYIIISEEKEIHVLDLYGDDWKWYDEYEDVKAWMKFMHEAPEMNLEYEFIRIGEETGDVETESSDNNEMFIRVTNPSIAEDFEIHKEIPIFF